MKKDKFSSVLNGIKKATIGFFSIIGCFFFLAFLYFCFVEEQDKQKIQNSNYEMGYMAGYEKAKKEFETNQGEKQ